MKYCGWFCRLTAVVLLTTSAARWLKKSTIFASYSGSMRFPSRVKTLPLRCQPPLSSVSRVRNKSESSVMSKKSFERNAPRIAIWVVIVPQDRDVAVDRSGKGGVAAVTEDRQRPRVRVDERDLFRCEREHPVGGSRVRQCQAGRTRTSPQAHAMPCQPEKANRISAASPRPEKIPLRFSKSNSEATAPRSSEAAEQILATGASGDRSRDDAANPARRTYDCRKSFSKQLICLQLN